MERARGVHADPLRTVRRTPARWWLGGVPAGAAGHGQALAMGPGPDGDPGERARASAGLADAGPHSRRGARHQGRAVGNGGGGKMLLSFSRDRRNLGRPAHARLHRDSAAGGRLGAQRHALLAGAAGWRGQPQRCADALANRERAIVGERTRSARAGDSVVARRAVPRARVSAGAVGYHA